MLVGVSFLLLATYVAVDSLPLVDLVACEPLFLP
jgi:hypothetical protein